MGSFVVRGKGGGREGHGKGKQRDEGKKTPKNKFLVMALKIF